MIFIISLPAALVGELGGIFVYYLIKIGLRVLFAVCFIRGRVLGTEKVPPDGKVILISNMPTLFDPLFFIAFFPRRLKFISEPSMFKIPFLGWMMRVIGCIPVPAGKADYLVFAKRISGSLPALVFRGSAGLAGISGIKTMAIEISGSNSVISSGLISPGKILIRV